MQYFAAAGGLLFIFFLLWFGVTDRIAKKIVDIIEFMKERKNQE